MKGEKHALGNKMKTPINAKQKKAYEKVIEEATVDCYGEYEQISGWVCFLDECIKTPCKCTVGKETAVLEKIDADDNGNVVVGLIKLNKTKMRVLIQDVILENQKATAYVNAYAYWCKEG